MLTIKALPTSIVIRNDQPVFEPLIGLLVKMAELAAGPDRSTSLDVPARELAMLFAGAESDNTTVLVVNLPAHAAPHVANLLASPLEVGTLGAHLAQCHVCLSFRSEKSEPTLDVDVQHIWEALNAVSLGKAHLVLAVACTGTLHLRLLDDDLRDEYPEEGWGPLQSAFFSADNYKPLREYPFQELQDSLNDYQAQFALPQDSSIVNFRPEPLARPG